MFAVHVLCLGFINVKPRDWLLRVDCLKKMPILCPDHGQMQHKTLSQCNSLPVLRFQHIKFQVTHFIAVMD